MAITNTSHKSSWIESIGYLHTKDAGWLVVFTNRGSAILYQGVPSTLPGLLAAGQSNTKDGHRSVGASYNRLIKGKYQGQTVTDPAEVNYLKTVCK